MISFFQRIQRKLDFQEWSDAEYPHFSKPKGLGRVTLISSILSFLLGLHVCIILICIVNTEAIPQKMLIRWSFYVTFLCLFHLLEFFVTAVWNPKQLDANSFVVNQSVLYTTFAIISWMEFWIRFFFFPSHKNQLFHVGIVVCLFGQMIRTLAMKTCGENFNHFIQHTKQPYHILVTNGIYKYLRHPSYTGFFYWSIGTQLILGNPINFLLYCIACWKFFQKRIRYEEQLLKQLFVEYEEYRKRSWIAIPFIKSI